MAKAADKPIYPPTPESVPEDYAEPLPAYQSRVLLVLASLIVFFFFYIGMIVASVAVMFLAAIAPGPGTILCAIAAFLWFLFLLKGFFKRSPVDESLSLEVTEEEHPKLFWFLRRLCKETGADLPHRVFLTPDVNAAVCYNQSLFHMFLPAPKNLIIGMGLVNSLNLSEFKAVLAHEFGHFRQSSMKLHTHVYSANQLIIDLIHGRDWFDQLLEGAKYSDPRIALFAWLFYGVLWTFRKILEGIFRGINLLSLSLSREMEFNADRVASSVAGSDAIVHALYRLDFANASLMQAHADLMTAAQHELFTWDLYYHQVHAATHLRRVHKDPQLGKPPPLPDSPKLVMELFDPEDTSVPAMWSTHPPNYEREQNVKANYLRCPQDERSPWMLFHNPRAVREEMTLRFYHLILPHSKNSVLSDPEEVQRFIDDEHAETTYDPRYQGMYDGRVMETGDLDDLTRQVRRKPRSTERLSRLHASLYGDDFESRMEDHNQSCKDHAMLSGIADGTTKPKQGTFKFRGKKRRAHEAKKLLKKVEKELEEDKVWMAKHDALSFACHYQMALALGEEWAPELRGRYEFHLAIQDIALKLTVEQARMAAALEFCNQRSQLSESEFAHVLQAFREAHDTLVQSIARADCMQLPALKNLTKGESLGTFLLEEKLVKQFKLSTTAVKAEKIERFLNQLNRAAEKTCRIHAKSLGAILALQEQIADTWREGQFRDATTMAPADRHSRPAQRPAGQSQPHERTRNP